MVATDARQAGRETSQGRSSRTERARQVCTYQLTPCRDKMEDGPEQTDSRPRPHRSAFGSLESYRGDMVLASYRMKSCIVGRVKVAASMRWRLVFVSWIGRLRRRVVKTLRSHGTGQDRRRQASPRREQRKSKTGSQGCDQMRSRPGLEASGAVSSCRCESGGM